MIKGAVGVYIGSNYVDMVELTGVTFAPRLQNYVREEIRPTAAEKTKDTAQPEEAASDESVISAVREGLGRLKAEAKGIYTVLSFRDVMIRNFSMPPLPRSEQAQAIKFESRKYVPFKMDEVISDFKVSQPTKGRNALDIFFIAATRQNLESHLQVFKSADAQPRGVDIIPFALARLLILHKKISPKEAAAVLYLDSDRASAMIHIVDSGMPFLSRDLKISIEDKEALFEKLAGELRVSIDYYRRQNPQTDITKIAVCGENIYPGLGAFITDELKIVTETLEYLEEIKGAEKLPSSYIIAAGAALGGLGRSPYSINLSPGALVAGKRRQANIIMAEAALALFITIAVFISGQAQSRIISGELNRLKEKGKDLPNETVSLGAKSLELLKQKRLAEVVFLQAILNNRLSWAEKVARIAKDMPDGLWVERLTCKESFTGSTSGYPSNIKRAILIKGSAFSPESSQEIESITKFSTNIKNDEVFKRHFKDIRLGSIDKKQISGYWASLFSIDAQGEEALSLIKTGAKSAADSSIKSAKEKVEEE